MAGETEAPTDRRTDAQSLHRYSDDIATKTEHEPLTLGFEMKDDAGVVLEPKITAAKIA